MGETIRRDPGTKVMEGIYSSKLSLLNWKRHKLGHVHNSINSKQHQLDALQQGFPIDINQLDTRTFSREIVARLDVLFTEEGVKKCLFSMAGTKAPGPDAMSAISSNITRIR
ncbi:hypothetical protein LIER_23306 [Lithospermum erythrorhizon]|uniref:Uncharacterized protein n=1 Tax=Lithospermum erythrorhizon TaxID=34254 RepID=A0AAV3R163_LITER